MPARYTLSPFILTLGRLPAWADHGGVSAWYAVKPLVDEAITTITFVCPGPRCRLRLTRTVLASGGALHVDTLKNSRVRTAPLVDELVPSVDWWRVGKPPGAWLFDAPASGPLRESDWKRSVVWRGDGGDRCPIVAGSRPAPGGSVTLAGIWR